MAKANILTTRTINYLELVGNGKSYRVLSPPTRPYTVVSGLNSNPLDPTYHRAAKAVNGGYSSGPATSPEMADLRTWRSL